MLLMILERENFVFMCNCILFIIKTMHLHRVFHLNTFLVLIFKADKHIFYKTFSEKNYFIFILPEFLNVYFKKPINILYII